jgi:hypothetical protein
MRSCIRTVYKHIQQAYIEERLIIEVLNAINKKQQVSIIMLI